MTNEQETAMMQRLLRVFRQGKALFSAGPAGEDVTAQLLLAEFRRAPAQAAPAAPSSLAVFTGPTFELRAPPLPPAAKPPAGGLSANVRKYLALTGEGKAALDDWDKQHGMK